jgi:short-subunit dehydrogenase
MNNLALVITGTAPCSLGEAIVREYSQRFPRKQIIGLDILHNKNLEAYSSFREIIFNLNPFDHPRGFDSYVQDLRSNINGALIKIGAAGISNLIQAAGVYDLGHFIDNSVASRKRLLGVNTIARTELLHLILSINAFRNIDSTRALSYVDIGAAHGMNATSGRSLYAASKAFGLDFCSALQKGSEIHRCIHFVPGPIDTHMLHRTHWVHRANGDPDFFDQIYLNRPERYKSIFVHCDEISIQEEAVIRSLDTSRILEAFAKYCEHRKLAFHTADGILDPHLCAKTVINILSEPTRYQPGIYFATSPANTGLKVQRLPFSTLIRRRLFEVEAQAELLE